MQPTITLRRLDPQFPVCSLPFGELIQVSAGMQNRKAQTRMQFVELFGQIDLCWRATVQLDFVTGYEGVDVIHHTVRIHPASVFSASSSARTWLACFGMLQRGCGHWRALGQVYYSSQQGWDGILFPLEFVSHPTQSGETILVFWLLVPTSLIR
jgi:hypothetical protein